MPQNVSAKKRLRQARSRLVANRSQKQEIKTRSKTFMTLLESGNLEEAEGVLRTVTKKIDKASKKHIIHANKASRMKSLLARALNRARTKGNAGAAAVAESAPSSSSSPSP